MKSIWRAASVITCVVAMVTLLRCGGGSSQPIQTLMITSATLPNGTAGTQYNQSVTATGGVAPYTWSVSAGAPPENLQLGSSHTNTDTISGMPDTPVQSDAFTIKVTDSANQSATRPYTVSILGLPDTLTLAPASLGFSPLLTGTSSASQMATLTNTGTTSVAINSVVSTGTNAGDFTQSNNCVPSLPPGANCGITVTFTPGQTGPRVALITIDDDTAGTPHQLGLNGIGLSAGANATLSATSLTFNGQEVGSTSPALTLTLTNYGKAALNITGIAASGSFSVSTTCGATLSPGASCPINVSFSPTTSGNLTGTLSVTDNATGSPQTVPLNGTGAASGTPVLSGMCTGDALGGQVCGAATDLAECPAGEAAVSPTNMLCGVGGNVNVDNSRGCTVNLPRVNIPNGRCATVAASASSRAAAIRSCKSVRKNVQ